MPNNKNNYTAETFDAIEYEKSPDSNSVIKSASDLGQFDAMQQLQHSLSAIEMDYVKSINIGALNAISDSLNKALKPFNMEAISGIAKAASLVNKIDFQKVLEPSTAIFNQYLTSINKPWLSDSVIRAFENIQLPTLAFSKIAIQTPMIEALTSALVNLDYYSCYSIANETLAKPRISAPDVAFFKTTALAKEMRPELKYPRGFSSSLKTLNHHSAYTISANSDIDYDVQNKGFIVNGIDDDGGIVLPNEINVVCAGKYVLNDIVTETSESEIVTETELIEFMSFLFKTPTQGSTHPVGKKIFQFIQDLMNMDSKYKHGFDKDVFFHSRARKEGERPFIFDEMLKAPIGVTGPGRYNFPGRSHYYFADSKEGAEAEIQKHNQNSIVQTLRILPKKGENIVLLDLSSTMKRGTTLLRYTRYSLSSRDDNAPREYLIPCYIADCCKRIGFDGIKYYGGKNYSNYVVWNDGYFENGGMVE